LDRHLAEEAIKRLDTLCDFLHRLAAKSPKDGWPQDLQIACQKIAKEVEALTGALDKAEGDHALLHDLTAEAREHLPKDLAAFGAALAEDLAKLLLPKLRP
jgi:hypothetical protein